MGTRFLLIAKLLLIASVINAQNNDTYISGLIIDSKTQQPVPFATVYVNGSTLGCVSNENGEFILTGLTFPSQIVISHISYKSKVLDINNQSEDIRIPLNLKVIAMEEVAIETKGISRYARNRYIRRFEDYFLGTDNWGRRAKLLNDSVLIFHQDTLGFYAIASSPLEIDLPLLGYKLNIDLLHFQIIYNEIYQADQCEFTAGYYFIPIIPNNRREARRLEQNRLKAYYGSELHFCRTLYDDQLNENGYEIYRKKKVTSLKSLTFSGKIVMDTILEPADLQKEYVININNAVDLQFQGYKDSSFAIIYYHKNGFPVNIQNAKLRDYFVSWLFLMKDTCIIRSNGTLPDNSIMFDGTIGNRKVGSMLPQDYYPELSVQKPTYYIYNSFEEIKVGITISEFNNIREKNKRGMVNQLHCGNFTVIETETGPYDKLYEVEPHFNNEKIDPESARDNPDLCTVGRIFVYSSDFKTREGISQGNTLGELKSIYTLKELVTEKETCQTLQGNIWGLEKLGVSVEETNLVFYIDINKLPRAVRKNPTLDRLPNKTKIYFIGIS